MRKTLVPAAFLLLFAAGCAQIDYIGDYYPPTANVEVFLKAEDVKRDHKVMGEITARIPDGFSTEQAQQQVKQKACSVGADAILMSSVETVQVGESTYGSKHGEVHATKKGVAGNESESSHTYVEREHVMKAKCLKYKGQ
jgi:hypothetical protein